MRIRFLPLTTLLILTSGCRASGPTLIPPAPAAEQPTYTVQRGTVSRQLEFTARVAPVQQAELFFRADSR